MLRKLEVDALKADLSAIDEMLASFTEDDDPIGWYQFSARKEEIERSLGEIVSLPHTHAELGVFFGGRPVEGSRGINADFAGKALEDLQALVSKRYSGREFGRLAQRGPVPGGDASHMLVTGIVRGSVGFVLEEPGNGPQLIETPLKEVVDEVADILWRVGADEEAVFEEAAAELDERLLVTLRQFFQRLDDFGATMRIVDGTRDFLLDRSAISRARERTQAIEIVERDTKMTGSLFVLPESKRFDLLTTIDNQEVTIKGTVSPSVVRQMHGQGTDDQPPVDPRSITQTPWDVEVKTRELRERSRPTRRVYTLQKLFLPKPRDE